MAERGWSTKEVLDPRGAWTLVSEIRKGNPSRAFTAQNVRFSPGRVYSREGTSTVFSTAGKVTSMYNWVSTLQQNLLLYFDGTTVKQAVILAGYATTNLETSVTSTRAVTFGDLGPRIYWAGYNTNNVGTIQAHVYDGSSTSGTPNVDTCFRAPLTFSAFTAVDGGAGRCTIGQHYFGFIFQSRSGFAGQPSPAPSNVFTPVSITLNGTNRTITLSITLNTPADAGVNSAIYPIMTPASNPNSWFFVPGVSAVLPANASAWTQTFTISITDEDLINTGESASNQFNLLAQNQSGVGPITPSVTRPYGRRMCYVVGNTVYISDITDPQAITADFNIVQTQGQKTVATICQLGQQLYLFGDRWTAVVTDNGDYPSTWAEPQSVSDSIGTTAIQGVEWRTAGPYIWIAAEPGLYLFNGSYPSRPITYLYGDQWARINWTAAYAIQVVDDPTKMKCWVAVPLDSSTEPNALFVIDYTNGMTYDTVDITVDTYAAGTFSSIARVKEYQNQRSNLWIGPSAAGSILHQDTTVITDNGAAIDSIWESGFIRESGELDSPTIRVGAAHFGLSGAGTITQIWYGKDRTYSATPAPISLSTSLGKDMYTKFDLHPVENYTCRLEMSGQTTGFWQLTKIKPYFKPSLYTR